MPRLTAQNFDQELLILFDAYVHGSLDRRGFLDQAQRFAKAGVTAAGLLAALSPNFAAGQQVRVVPGRPPGPAGAAGDPLSQAGSGGEGAAQGHIASTHEVPPLRS